MKRTLLTLVTLASLAACKQTPTEIPQGITGIHLNWKLDADSSKQCGTVGNTKAAISKTGTETSFIYLNESIDCRTINGRLGCVEIQEDASILTILEGTAYTVQLIIKPEPNLTCTYVAQGNVVD